MAKLFNLVCDGNSITAGQEALPNADAAGWPTGVRTGQSNLNRVWTVKVAAISGRPTPTNTAQIPNTIVPQFNRGFGMNIVTFFEGINDVVFNAATLSTAQNNWAAYVAAARAAGYKVMAMTPLPTGNTGNGANVIMPQLAQWVRDNPQLSDFPVIDIAANASLSVPGNVTFYADNTHPNNAGYAVIAGMVLTALNAIP